MAFFKILFLPFFLFLSGCSFLDLKDDLEKQDQLVTISGKIILDSRSSAPIMVLLIKDDQNRPTLNHYRKIEKSNEFSFIVEPGIYRIYAYEDANRDEKFNPAEQAAHTPILTMSVPGMHQKTDIVIKSSADKDLLDKIDVLKKTGLVDIVNARRYLGQVTSLDADCFSQENVSKGLWQPYAFATEVPLGIFFLEKYDPNKKPVLFIHGISGSPTQFSFLIDNLDRSRFQPMVAYYPSGFPLSLIAQYFDSLIEELHVKYNFKKLSVVAHSMGGLVSRELINIQSNRQHPLVDCFISVSTPWNGHTAAGSGLKYAPVIIPVWQDMAPESRFLETLFTIPLPKETSHYLLFGFKGDSITAEGNSDGVVSIGSQLRPAAQQGADMVRGFDEDHTSILKNPDVSTLINTLLEEHLSITVNQN